MPITPDIIVFDSHPGTRLIQLSKGLLIVLMTEFILIKIEEKKWFIRYTLIREAGR
jgi:hypothetical protein